jgi:predicted DNA-binding protein
VREAIRLHIEKVDLMSLLKEQFRRVDGGASQRLVEVFQCERTIFGAASG